MLTFRNTSVAAAVIVTVLFLINAFIPVPWYGFAAIAFVYTLFLFFGSYRVDSSFYMPVICSAKTDEKKIAISFDDGPETENTSAILEILESRDIKVAFFCIGKKIPGKEDILHRAVQNDHLVANHSFSHHVLFDLFSSAKMYADLQEANQRITEATGLTPKLFRPPYGVTNPNLKKAVAKSGFVAVGWNVRSYDTVIKDEQKLLKRIIDAIKPGAVFLFHDTCNSTLAVLPDFLNELNRQGYQVERIDRLLKIQAYA